MSLVQLYVMAFVIGALASAASGLCFGYAAIVRAKAWLKWAERCDPKGIFHGPSPVSLKHAGRSAPDA
jgi:hypothetical protein